MEIKLILVTCPDSETAKSIATQLIEQKLAACVNVIPGLTSIYRWEGKVENSQEVLMLIKTSAAQVDSLEKTIAELHPYDVPEFVILDSSHVEQKYRDWLLSSCS